MAEEIKFPTEFIELPSKGLLYPETSPLHSGKVEMKYMTAAEEDLLTTQSYIEKGIVMDKLIQALIVDKSIDYNELLSCDIDALLIAARILGYGKDYEFEYRGRTEVVDLTTLPLRELKPEILKAQSNNFEFTLPSSKVNITFKLLTHGDSQKIEQELKGLQKLRREVSADLSTRLKYIITSVNGDDTVATIRQFVDKGLLAIDARALRKHMSEIMPGIDTRFYPEDGPEEGIEIPIGANFLYPDLS